jgi:starch-binding outer membrane protein, SusD/RagB family
MKKLATVFFIQVVLLTSCDFLEENPQSVINSGTFYKTESDAVAATNAVYDYMTVGTAPIFDPNFGGIFFNDYWVFKDVLSDNCTETITGPDYGTLNEFSFTAENVRIELYWQSIYQTVNAANIVIDRVPLIPMDEARRDHLVAEVRFIRAIMYFEAVRLFGDAPLILHETVNLTDAFVPRSPRASVYEAIIEDLEWSRDHLMTTGDRVGMGRATPIACTALLSRVYLEMGEYDLAAENAKTVIESGKHPLFNDFAKLFKQENANSGEIIFAANYSGTQSQGFKPNQYLVRLLPPHLYDKKLNEGPQNAWGWEIPTDDLYNNFDPQDRRREVTFISSFTYSNDSVATFRPHIGKFWDQEKEPLGNNTDMDVIYLRTADIMLIYAEALNEINNGPDAKAYEMINAVRKRARFNGTTELDILPDLSGLNYEQFKDAVLQERRFELVMEGSRYHDLVRMGKLVEKVSAAKPFATPKDYHVLLPIPQRERNLNTNLTQNSPY